MAKRKAPYTKQALYQAAKSLLDDGVLINTDSLVARLRSKFSDEIAKDRDDILDIGLRVLAGRITSTRLDDSPAEDMFGKERLLEFFPLRVFINNKVVCTSALARTLTPRKLDEQPPTTIRNKPKENRILKYLDEMRAKGLMDMTLEEYLNRGA